MPELPEVETIKRGLEKKIIGLKIAKVEVLNPNSFQDEPDRVKGKIITNVWRRGKVLGIDCQSSLRTNVKQSRHPEASSEGSQDSQSRDSSVRVPQNDKRVTLLFHLKMSGQIILISSQQSALSQQLVGGHPTKDMLGEMPNKSTRVIFHLSSPIQSGIQKIDSHRSLPSSIIGGGNDKKGNGNDDNHAPPATSYTLFFNDQRKFGWIKLVGSPQLKAHSSLQGLGPEPLDPTFTWQILKQNLLRHKNLPVKVAILDQTTIAGIGNIYACEALFLAKINPSKPVSRLTTKDYRLLHQGIIQSLSASLEKGGSSRRHYLNESGEKGYFLDFAYVYDRKDQPCKICATPIDRIKLADRGTYFCPNCQR